MIVRILSISITLYELQGLETISIRCYESGFRILNSMLSLNINIFGFTVGRSNFTPMRLRYDINRFDSVRQQRNCR